MGEEALRISVRIKGELVNKVKAWKKFGFTLSDIVRQAIYLLPDSPSSMHKAEKSSQGVKPLCEESFTVKPKDERDALKALQEW
jgi:hypothetical protein